MDEHEEPCNRQACVRERNRLEEALETNGRLNRRCQQAESMLNRGDYWAWHWPRVRQRVREEETKRFEATLAQVKASHRKQARELRARVAELETENARLSAGPQWCDNTPVEVVANLQAELAAANARVAELERARDEWGASLRQHYKDLGAYRREIQRAEARCAELAAAIESARASISAAQVGADVGAWLDSAAEVLDNARQGGKEGGGPN